MEATVELMNLITTTFVDALQSGLATLTLFSLPLLGVFAVIAFYTQLWPLLANGSGLMADGLAATLLACVKFGVFYWILVNLGAMAAAALDTFLQWGLAPGGAAIALSTFRQPGVHQHERLSVPKKDDR